jgi:hypothetical protein
VVCVRGSLHEVGQNPVFGRSDMKQAIVLLSVLNVTFVLMHEFDACYRREWKMFAFLRRLGEESQYLLFLYVHLPLSLFLFYYLWTVINFNSLVLWLIWNGLIVVHSVVHVAAARWKSNVFHSVHSSLFIGGAALTSVLNLSLLNYYR